MHNDQVTWSSFDNINLSGTWSVPEENPAAVVCLVHGHGEHIGRYRHVIKRLTKEGYAVLGYDLRGHGSSGGLRGHCPTFDAHMQDIDLLLKEAGRRFPNRAKFLYGHSLGGILVLNYTLRRKPDLAGVIATSPGLNTAIQEQKGKVLLARTLGSIAPQLTIKSGLNTGHISRDKTVVQAYINDPLVHDKMTTRMGKELLKSIDYAFSHASELAIPLLLMHGDADKIAYPSGSEKFAALVKNHCTLKIWPGRYHEIHNEFDKEEVFHYLIDWLTDRTAGSIPGQSGSGMGKFDPVG